MINLNKIIICKINNFKISKQINFKIIIMNSLNKIKCKITLIKIINNKIKKHINQFKQTILVIQ